MLAVGLRPGLQVRVFFQPLELKECNWLRPEADQAETRYLRKYSLGWCAVRRRHAEVVVQGLGVVEIDVEEDDGIPPGDVAVGDAALQHVAEHLD